MRKTSVFRKRDSPSMMVHAYNPNPGLHSKSRPCQGRKEGKKEGREEGRKGEGERERERERKLGTGGSHL
jgi:hypothetical protein